MPQSCSDGRHGVTDLLDGRGHVLVVDVGISSVVSSTGHSIKHLVTVISSISETRLETGTSVGVYADDDELGSGIPSNR
jgi:hypothetical protein